MERNLMRRIEVAFPILDPELAARVFEETLANYLADNTQAWLLDSEGVTRAEPGENPPYTARSRSARAVLSVRFQRFQNIIRCVTSDHHSCMRESHQSTRSLREPQRFRHRSRMAN
jgi:hypothetical protein